MVRVGPM